MENSVIRALMKADGFLMVNRSVVATFGMDEAILLAELMRWEDYFSRNSKIEDGGWFYITLEHLEENTGFSGKQTRRVVESMKKDGILEVEKRGMPARNYYRVKYEMVLQSLQKVTTSGALLSPHTIKEIVNNTRTSYARSQELSEQHSTERILVLVDEEGREKGVPIPKTPKGAKEPDAFTQFVKKFQDMCVAKGMPRPIVAGWMRKQVLKDFTESGLTQRQALDLMEDWFSGDRKDQEMINMGFAFGARSINDYKARNNLK